VGSKKLRWTILALTLALALAAGGVALAQEQGTGSPADLPEIFWSKLAAALGVDEARLQEAVRSAADQTIDEGVRQGILPEEKAQRLREGLEQGVWPGPFFGGQRGFGGRRGGFGPEVAEILDMTPQELHEALQSGKTLEQMAADKGLTLEQLKEKVLEARKAELQKLVEEGKLTREKADEILSRLENMDLTKCPPPVPKGRPQAEQ
jgi:ribosomal protein S20